MVDRLLSPLEAIAVDYAAAWRRNLDTLRAMATERALNGNKNPELYRALETWHNRTLHEVDVALASIREHVDADYATETAEALKWKGLLEAPLK
jgi:hypothetical protein